MSIAAIYQGFLIPLVAFSYFLSLLGMLWFGYTTSPVGHYYWPLGSGLVFTIIKITCILVSVYPSALLVQHWFKLLGVVISKVHAFQLVAFSLTPIFIGNLLGFLPMLSTLSGCIGLYAFCVFFYGIVPMARITEEQRLPFFFGGSVAVVIMLACFSLIAMPFQPSPTA